MLPKIQKPNNQRRPTINGIGSITENLSVYVDHHLKTLVPRIPSYIKDTNHILNLLLVLELTSGDLLVTIDVYSLYTNIPNNEGISATNRSLEERDRPT